MEKFLRGAALVGLVSASVVANAAVLDFNTPAIETSGSAVPLRAGGAVVTGSNMGGFISPSFTYQGFTFEYAVLPGVPTNHSWIWTNEGSNWAGSLGSVFDSDPGVSVNSANGFLAHGCQDAGCSAVSTTSFSISNPTPFTFQSLDIARYYQDTASINLFTNIGDLSPAQTIIVPISNLNFEPVTIVNTAFASELFTKITIDGFKGYYGIDNIVYAPVPEPGTYALMLGGMALVGALARRNRRH